MQIHQFLLPFVVSSSLLAGCASITKDATQPIKIETYSKENKMLEDVKCTAKGEYGETSSKTPSAVVIHRSGKNLEIKCEKENLETGYGTLISRANGSMFGNILFGGGIGAIIDHNTGKAYSYPDWVRIIMGDNLVYDRKNNKDNEVMLGSAASIQALKNIEAEKVEQEKAAIEAAKQKQSEK